MELAICGGAVNWSATGDMLQGWGALAGALALIFAARVGANTFARWKQEKLGERHLAEAERILTASYRARRELSYIRAPMMGGNENAIAEQEVKHTPFFQESIEAKQRRIIHAQSIINRLKRGQSSRDALDECLPIARAFFGEELEKAVDSLGHQFWIVYVNVESYIDDGGEDRDFTLSIRRALYDSRKDNEVTDAIAAAVETIERILLPVLRSA